MRYEELKEKYCSIVLETSPKLYFEAAVAEIDLEFAEGTITQKEWAKLYQIMCEWL